MVKNGTAKKIGTIGCVAGCTLMLVGFAIVGPALLLAAAFWFASERTVYSRELSPNGSFEARVQFDNCGAPCEYTKSVFVKRTWLASDSPWLSCPAFGAEGTNDVELRWLDSSHLLIRHGFVPSEVVGWSDYCGSVTVETAFDPKLVADSP